MARRGPGPGSGRFKRLVRKLQEEKGLSKESAQKLAAWIGRKKYGAEQMAKWAAAGRRRKK